MAAVNSTGLPDEVGPTGLPLLDGLLTVGSSAGLNAGSLLLYASAATGAYAIWEQLRFRMARKRKDGKLVPGPDRVTPFLGGLVEMVMDPYRFWEKQKDAANITNPGYSYNSLFGKMIMTVTDADKCRELMAVNDPQRMLMVLHPSAKTILGANNLAFLHGPEHKAMRKSFVSLFTRKALSTYTELQDGIIRRHLAEWMKQPKFREMRDDVRDMNQATSQDVFVGPYLDDPEVRTKFSKSYYAMTDGFLAFPVCLPGTAVWKARKGRMYIFEVLKTAASRAREFIKQGGEPRCLMDFWAQKCLAEIEEAEAQGLPPPNHTTIHRMADAMIDFLFASQDASTASLVWCLTLMAALCSMSQLRAAASLAVQPVSGAPALSRFSGSSCKSFLAPPQRLPSRPAAAKPSHPRRQRCRPANASFAGGMLSSLARALGGQGGATTAAPQQQAIRFADNAPTWEELQAAVEAKQQALDAVPPPLETGPAHSYALRRTFGQPGEPRVKLYRDHAAWCPYCHKIVLQLEEKQIPYVIEKINMRCYGDKPPEFLRKVPSGLLPVLEVDGQVITESAVIQQVLEQLQPQPAMLPPAGSPERQRAAELMRLERQLFSAWLQWLCNGWGHESNRDNFCKTMDAVEAALGQAEGPYFLPEFGLVDITFAPFLERIVSSIAYYKGFRVRGEGRWPNLERWFAAMEARPAYAGFKSDHYTHVHDLPPQLGGCVSVPEAKPFADAIDGRDGKSWRLPLEPLSATSLEAHTPEEHPEIDRLQAAARLVQNREAVTKFCLRGAPGGKRGPRPVSAPLCDPTAIPALEHWDAADAALRHVAHALLLGVEAKQASPQALAAAAGGGAAGHDGGNVAPALAYLRDRVCVPRDLKLPAARQFRAHLNWAIDTLQQQ